MPDKDYTARPLIDKLGIKPGACVAVLGINDPAFVETLAARTTNYCVGKCQGACDVILLGVKTITELRQISECPSAMTPAGGIWVIYPKGRKDITEAHVMGAGLAAGLVDNKVCSFSATHTGMRFVVRQKDRPKA